MNEMSVIAEPTLRNGRIGKQERTILNILHRQGAKTLHELARTIEKKEITTTREKAYQRTAKQLRDKGLITTKPYFKYEPCFIMYFSKRFYAEGCLWRIYNGPGFCVERTRQRGYGYYHILGLTSLGHKTATQITEQEGLLE
jgi:hypothetical protein